MRIGVSLLYFLFYTPALLQDPIASFDPKFLCSYFHLRAFMRSFSGHRTHFELFGFLFHLKPQPYSYVLDVVGGAGLQLRQGKDKLYIPYKLSSKVIDWKPKWLYIETNGKPY